VFVCENNLYGEFTPMRKVTGGGEIAVRAAAYGVPFEVVDGNDLWAVHDAAQRAVARARAGDGPTLLECQTYRHFGHSKSDPAPYRPAEEVGRWPSSPRRSRPLARRHSPIPRNGRRGSSRHERARVQGGDPRRDRRGARA
jgi:TPP-dependent pyruvate/acetoin dehydrogenase alpha subunit